MPRVPDFGARAARYDELRPADASWWELYDVLVREGDLRGRRILEVGCGTGQLAAALAGRSAARVWAVDAEPAMVELARRRGVAAKVARAEALPFKDGWFERVVMRLAVHLLDEDELAEGAARAERELADRVEVRLEWALVVADA